MNVIRTLRKARGLSQAELAKALNVHQTAVSQWENQRTSPDMAQAKQLADYFDVSIDYLLGRSATPAPQGTKKETPLVEQGALELYQTLVDIGYVQPGEALSPAKQKALLDFVDKNIELIRAYAKEFEKGGE